MEGIQTDIQALLQEISGNYGDPEPEQAPLLSLPYSRPISNLYKSRAERSMVSKNALTPIHEQQSHYESQASRSQDAYSYSTLNDPNLDAYGSYVDLDVENKPADCYLDQALLAEPQPHLHCQANNSMSTLPVGRLSLPGHTAPHTSVNAAPQLKAQQRRGGESLRVPNMFHCS